MKLKAFQGVAFGLLAALLLSCSDDEAPVEPPMPDPDDTPPTVLSVEPGHGNTNVGLSQVVEVTFNEDMDDNVENTFVTMSDAFPDAFTWLNSRTLEITHTPWTEATNVTITLSTGFADEAGNNLAAPYEWSFWTETPTVQFLTSVPPDGATDVNRNTKVMMLFSKEMQLFNLESAMTVEDGSGPLGFTLEAADDNWVELTFDSALPANTQIDIAISTAATDVSSAPLESAVAFSFTTGTTIDTTPPTLVSIVPANGSTISQSTSSIVFTFSEAIDTDTFNPSRISAQLMLVVGEASVVWSPDGTQLTVPLPTPLPAGMPFLADFESYADVAGNVQTAPINYRVDVAGTASPWPFVDGSRYSFYEHWTDTPVGESPNVGETQNFYGMVAQGSSVYHWTTYTDETFSTPGDYEAFRVTSNSIDFIGFGDGSEDVTFSPDIEWVKLPFAVGNWSGTTNASAGGGSAMIDYEIEVFAQEDVLSVFGDEFQEVVWVDCWKVVRSWMIEFGPETTTGTMTTWYAPGIGPVKMHEFETRDDGSTYESVEDLIGFD